MSKYRKKPVVFEATQWYKAGDHPLFVGPVPSFFGNSVSCGYCDHPRELHGFVSTLVGGHIVCPGDWIITGLKGEHYTCKPDIFEATYAPIVESDPS